MRASNVELISPSFYNQGPISSTFHEQLLYPQIIKVQKRLTTWSISPTIYFSKTKIWWHVRKAKEDYWRCTKTWESAPKPEKLWKSAPKPEKVWGSPNSQKYYSWDL